MKTLFGEPETVPVARPSRPYPEIAAAVAEIRAARNEFDKATAVAGAVWLFEADELEAVAELLIDRLQAELPEEWHEGVSARIPALLARDRSA